MRRKTECGKICLIADEGKRMNYGEIYTRKVYLNSETEIALWKEVDEPPSPEEPITPEQIISRLEEIL